MIFNQSLYLDALYIWLTDSRFVLVCNHQNRIKLDRFALHPVHSIDLENCTLLRLVLLALYLHESVHRFILKYQEIRY